MKCSSKVQTTTDKLLDLLKNQDYAALKNELKEANGKKEKLNAKKESDQHKRLKLSFRTSNFSAVKKHKKDHTIIDKSLDVYTTNYEILDY